MAQELDANLSARLGLAPVVVTAGGAADNVAQNGPAIEKAGFHQALAVVVANSALAAGQSATVTAKLQHRSGAAAWADFGAPEVLNLSPAAPNGVIEIGADLDGADQQIRLVVTANPSAASIDTVTVGGTVILGEADRLPV